jgi:adenylylsulfate reductase subunit B
MSIKIKSQQCRGCGACVEVCPGNLLRLGADGKASILRPEECWGCTSCLKECRFGAIRFFLGADIGGQGSQMYVEKEGPLSHWIVEPPEGTPITITVDSRNSNQY